MTYPEPPLAVLGLDLLAVAQPVAVPAPQGGRVVHADGVDALDLEPGGLEAIDDEADRKSVV